jgi:hypothetical protein
VNDECFHNRQVLPDCLGKLQLDVNGRIQLYVAMVAECPDAFKGVLLGDTGEEPEDEDCGKPRLSFLHLIIY